MPNHERYHGIEVAEYRRRRNTGELLTDRGSVRGIDDLRTREEPVGHIREAAEFLLPGGLQLTILIDFRHQGETYLTGTRGKAGNIVEVLGELAVSRVPGSCQARRVRARGTGQIAPSPEAETRGGGRERQLPVGLAIGERWGGRGNPERGNDNESQQHA